MGMPRPIVQTMGSARLGGFDPGSEAEPPGLERESSAADATDANTTPTVLNKLQKWVRWRRCCGWPRCPAMLMAPQQSS